jgi:isoleucyl-tRNA synthetase
MAPFAPFLAEEIYHNLTGEESVHLAKWPEASAVDIDGAVISEMALLRDLITEGLDKRTVKVRQPLAQATITVTVLTEPYLEILKEELNVKEVVIKSDQKENITVDNMLTPELILEGQAREIIRAIQEGRKKAGFNVEDRVVLGYQGMEDVFAVHRVEISKEVLATTVQVGEISDAEYMTEAHIDGVTVAFWLKRN